MIDFHWSNPFAHSVRIRMQPNLGGGHLSTSRAQQGRALSVPAILVPMVLVRVALRMKHSAIEQTRVRYVVQPRAVFGRKARRVKGQATSRRACITFSPSWKRWRRMVSDERRRMAHRTIRIWSIGKWLWNENSMLLLRAP